MSRLRRKLAALSDARRFEDVFDVMCLQVAANLIPVAFVVAVLWTYSPALVATLLTMLAATLALVLPLIRRRARLVHIREAASNTMAGHVADSIANAETVRAFAREREEARIHAFNVGDFGAKTLRSWDYQNLRVNTVTSPMYVATNTLGLVVALAVNRRTAGSLEAVFITFSYYAAVTRVVWQFNSIYRSLESALTDAAQFTELLLEPPSVVDAADARAFAPRHLGVELRDVRFRYAATQPLLFDGFSLAIAPGTKVGLVGRSGGGKTTLTRLLLRFADVESGHILIGGPDAPDADVRRAAALAHAAEFIETLPAGYETLVGERGVKLSGGQRQRIAIARAILKDAPILVLDEATSSLDSESEALIQDALLTLMEARTAIVIAHRLSTVRRMDRLIVLDGGRIIEAGSHEALLERGGTYASLWARQSGGFLVAAEVGVAV